MCDERGDQQASLVRIRVNGATSDLHAADARYHDKCRRSFYSPKNVAAAAVSKEPQSSLKQNDLAFDAVLKIINEDRSEIWNSTDLYNLYLENHGNSLCKKSLVAKVSDHSGEDLIVLSSPGVANILLFRSKASSTLRIIPDDTDDINAAVTKVAKKICSESKNIPFDNGMYETRIDNDIASECVSDTLMELLVSISPKLKRTLPALLIGNIVSSILCNQATHLQICLGVLLRDSKEMVQTLHDFRVTCTYEELRKFKKSVAVAASSKASLSGIYDVKDGLIQFIADNFDRDISSQNGKKSTHSLAMIMTQMETDVEAKTSEKVPRLTNNDMKKPIEYDLEIVQYMGPKKPDMPESVNCQAVISDELISETKTLKARAQEIDLSFFQDMCKGKQCPEWNGYSTKITRMTGLSLHPKTKLTYMPLIDMPPAHHDTIMTAMTRAQELSQSAGQEYTFLTLDLQLYKLCIDVLWVHPDKFPNFYPRLGGMHLLMSFMGCIGTLMKDTGLTELLSPVFAGVSKMLSGKKFPQNVRALRMVTEELLRDLLKDKPIESNQDLMTTLEDIAVKSKTAKLWIDVVIKSTFIAMLYIRAEREGDVLLHIHSVELMRPYFFQAGHTHYARYSFIHLLIMKSLPAHVLSHFLKGDHVLRHIPGLWNGLWSDMFIETTFMKYGKGKYGIVGITLKPEALKSWALSLHVCGQISADISSMRETTDNVQNVHKEEEAGRIKSDTEDRMGLRKKLEQCINPLATEEHPADSIVNIATGRIGPPTVNVHDTVRLGTRQMNEFDGSLPAGFHGTIEKRFISMAETKKSVKVRGVKIYDTNLIYSRVIGLQASNRPVDIDDVLSYELAPVPTALFTESGEMRDAKAKSVLKSNTQKLLSTRRAQENIDVLVIDGSAYLYALPWPAPPATVQHYIEKLKYNIGQKLGKCDVYLIFDRYLEYSIKGATRTSRGTGMVHQLTLTTTLPAQKVVLTVTENKKQLIQLICEDLQNDKDFVDTYTQEHTLLITGENNPIEITKGLIIPRPDIATNHEEADVIIVQQTFMAIEQGAKCPSVMADDTDVYALLSHFYFLKGLNIPMFMESPVQGRQTVDIRATVKDQENAKILPNLLAAHGLSGCDTVAKCHGIGKTKVINALKQQKHSLRCLGDLNASWEDVLNQSTAFMLACYGVTKVNSMTQGRVNQWKTKVGRGNSNMPKLCSLPPTDAAFVENLKRAHLQICIWKHALDLNAPDLDPVQYGWKKDENTKSLVAVTVPSDTELAPSYIQELIKCSCSSDPPCVSANCGCNKAGLACSVFCTCKMTECYRTQTNADEEEDSDNDGDDEENDDN